MPKPIKLSTQVNIPSQEDKISCASKILTLGSCFSDHIGNKLSVHLFDTLVNPFGTIFNPISISKLLAQAIDNDLISESDLNANDNRYFHYDFHSAFDSLKPQLTENRINEALRKVKNYIKYTDFLILTFGTSIVYKLKSTNEIVSNCHKVPNYKFEKEFLSVEFMEEKMIQAINLIKKINPEVKIVITVSPVRHTKEGLVENSLSKSRLIDLCHRITDRKSFISYFPSYEIMMDELRDYRFYKADLIHPNDVAVDVIWACFLETYFHDAAIQKVKDISDINQAKNHIPFDPMSPEHEKFRHGQLKKIKRFSETYPEIDFKEIIRFFTS